MVLKAFHTDCLSLASRRQNEPIICNLGQKKKVGKKMSRENGDSNLPIEPIATIGRNLWTLYGLPSNEKLHDE